MVVAWKMMALRRRNHEDGGSMIDDDNADGTSVNKRPMKMVAGMCRSALIQREIQKKSTHALELH